MKKYEIALMYMAVSIIMIISVPIFHEGIHLMQNLGKKDIKEVCFLGIPSEKDTIAWVSVYNKTKEEVAKQEDDALPPTLIYQFGLFLISFTGFWMTKPDD